MKVFYNFFSFYGLGFRVRVTASVRVLGLGFSVRVSVTGSGNYLNENFVIIYCLFCHLVSRGVKITALNLVRIIRSVQRTELITVQ